ncbi:hypothetical protein ACFTZM_26930, partial [Streptomyces hydrogenans]
APALVTPLPPAAAIARAAVRRSAAPEAPETPPPPAPVPRSVGPALSSRSLLIKPAYDVIAT